MSDPLATLEGVALRIAAQLQQVPPEHHRLVTVAARALADGVPIDRVRASLAIDLAQGEVT